jgi:MFS family permease
MRGLIILQTTTFYAQDQFKEQFGTVDNGVLEISAKWQTSIQQAMACGELIGLVIAGYLSNSYGWRPILGGMMIFLTGSLFLFAFANSLGYLVAAMVMCGMCLVLIQMSRACADNSRDSLGSFPNWLHCIFFRNGPNMFAPVCDRLGWYLLGPGLLPRQCHKSWMSQP